MAHHRVTVALIAAIWGCLSLTFPRPAGAQGSLTLVTIRTDLGANDSLDWGQLGAPGYLSLIPNPFSAQSSGGLRIAGSLPTGQGPLDVLVQCPPTGGNPSCSVFGNFTPGDNVLFSNFGSLGPLALVFRAPVAGAGMQIEDDAASPFTATIQAFNGSTLLGTVTELGTDSTRADGSAIFIGVLSSSTNITSIVVSTQDSSGALGALLVNNLSIKTGGCQVSTTPCIGSPSDGATPQSSYLALSGTGTPQYQVEVLLDSTIATATEVDAEGNWETVIMDGPGVHTIQVQYPDGPLSPSISVTNAGPFPPPLVSPTVFEAMRVADVILTVDPNSRQIYLYGSTFSHAALFLGGDRQGTPLIAEAVPGKEAGALGEVRAAPLEMSTVYTGGRKVNLFRTVAPLTDSQRASIASWAQSITSGGLPYFNIFVDLISPFSKASFWWKLNNQAKLNQALQNIDREKTRADKFICSTLVWQAYLAGTGGSIDISTPNNSTIKGFLSEFADGPFVNATRPYWVFPDTLANSPLLYQAW